jgi:hypothetical protein
MCLEFYTLFSYLHVETEQFCMMIFGYFVNTLIFGAASGYTESREGNYFNFDWTKFSIYVNFVKL